MTHDDDIEPITSSRDTWRDQLLRAQSEQRAEQKDSFHGLEESLKSLREADNDIRLRVSEVDHHIAGIRDEIVELRVAQKLRDTHLDSFGQQIENVAKITEDTRRAVVRMISIIVTVLTTLGAIANWLLEGGSKTLEVLLSP